MLAGDGVLQRAGLQADLVHLATSFVHCLLHGDRNFAGLALAHADATIAITNHGECCETEDTTTLHHLGDAVDRNHLLAQAVVAFFLGLLLLLTLRFSHF